MGLQRVMKKVRLWRGKECPGLKPDDLCATYRGLKPAATPKGNDGDSDSASQNDEGRRCQTYASYFFQQPLQPAVRVHLSDGYEGEDSPGAGSWCVGSWCAGWWCAGSWWKTPGSGSGSDGLGGSGSGTGSGGDGVFGFCGGSCMAGV